MGRRPKDDSEKRKLIGARFDPEAFDFIERQASANGRSVGAEVEARVAATIGLDAEGLELAGMIAREIAIIQKITGKRWHRDLKTWAAVKEMLERGPIDERRPDRPQDDEALNAAFERLKTLKDERRRIVDQFAEVGLAIMEDPTSKVNAFFINALAAMDGGRSVARTTIEGAPESNDKVTALRLLDRLLELDVLIPQADKELNDLLTPYVDAGAEGALLYRERLKREAERRRDAGDDYSPMHLAGDFR